MFLFPITTVSNNGEKVAICNTSDEVDDVVYVFADAVNGMCRVTKVDIDSANFREAIGCAIIRSKIDQNTCIIVMQGQVEGVYTSFTPGNLLFVSEGGSIADTPPGRPTTGKRVYQRMGYVMSKQLLYIDPQDPMVVGP